MGRGLRKPPYTHGFLTRHGKPYFRFRKEGFKSVPLPGLPWSPEFMAAYEAAMQGAVPLEIGASRTKPGSVHAVVVNYYKHRLWLEGLSASSRAMRRPILERFREAHGNKPIDRLERHHIEKLLKSKAAFAQRNWLKTLRGLMAFCMEEDHLRRDPTNDVSLPKLPKSMGHMTWHEEHIEQYRRRHLYGTTARLALELLLNLAARRKDAFRLGRQHVRNGRLCWRPSKTLRSTGKEVKIRLLPEFQAALDAMPSSDSLTLLTTNHGRPFASEASFGNKFADWCREAGFVPIQCADGRTRSYRAHGLRKAACRLLAHAGCTAPEIMAISGHRTLAQVQIYIDDVNQERLADAAMDKLEATKMGAGKR